MCAALLEITPAAIYHRQCPRSWRPGPLAANSEHSPPILCTIALNRADVVKTQTDSRDSRKDSHCLFCSRVAAISAARRAARYFFS